MADTTFNSNFLAFTKTMTSNGKLVLMISLFLNYFMDAAFTYFMMWINSIQLVTHLPMMMVIVPGNVSAFLEAILPVITFDLIS